MNGKDELFKNLGIVFLCCLLVSEGTSPERYVSIIGGTHYCSGNLHVLYDGHQGLVCGDPSWGLKEASVICKQLGCGIVNYTYQHILRPEEMEVPLLYGVQCRGEEATIWECSSGSWGPFDGCECQCIVSLSCSGESAWVPAPPSLRWNQTKGIETSVETEE